MSKHAFEQTRWDLTDLLPAHEGTPLEELLAQLESAVAELEQRRPLLSADMEETLFLEMLAQVKAIREMATRLGAYGALWFSEDTQSSEALSFRNRMDQRLTAIQNRLLFFTLWWKDLDDEAAQRLLAVSGDEAYYLETVRRFKPHTLSEAEEKIINLKDVNGVNALNTVYTMLTNAFAFRLEVDGQVKELTRAELLPYIQGPDPDLRAAAYQEMFRVYGESGKVLAQIYDHIVQDWRSESVDLRSFASPIAVRNLSNDIPDPVVEALLETCRRNAGVFQRYFLWKAQRLGKDRLRRYDLYAPVSESDKTYPFDEAADLVLDTFARFSPQLADLARRVFAEGHLDAEIRKGKRSGAFCMSTLPELTPWVLVNYNGKASDVATMAHELGHAVHAQMAHEHSILTFHSTLPLAETSSVFAERLLTDRLLREEPDAAVRQDLLVNTLDDTYATVMRQAYFVLFEVQAHDMIAKGAMVEDLGQAYLENLEQQFGRSLELSDDFRWEWVSIPHIYHTPFYCYAYSFGQLLVLALYQQYLEQGSAFIPNYLRILAHGGSKSPDFILSEASIDMREAAFWQGGFDVISGMIDDLEKMG